MPATPHRWQDWAATARRCIRTRTCARPAEQGTPSFAGCRVVCLPRNLTGWIGRNIRLPSCGRLQCYFTDYDVLIDIGRPSRAVPVTPPGIRVMCHGGSIELRERRRCESGQPKRIEIRVAQALHRSPGAPPITAQRVARFDHSRARNCLPPQKLHERYSRYMSWVT